MKPLAKQLFVVLCFAACAEGMSCSPQAKVNTPNKIVSTVAPVNPRPPVDASTPSECLPACSGALPVCDYATLTCAVCTVAEGCADTEFCDTTATNGACRTRPEQSFAIPRGPSRSSGVAPLAVFFSAGFSGSTADQRLFHDQEYAWDFGDGAGATWSTTGLSKNGAKGPVSFHVYEAAGTFTATLVVRNADGIVDSAAFTIEVSDPNVVFGGANTTCLSTNDDFAGCPAGAARVTTGDLMTLPQYTGSGKRVLLRRGAGWTVPNTVYPNYPPETVTVHIGAFGACQSPDAMGICSNAPQITVTNDNADAAPIHLHRSHDWRVTDLSFVGDKAVPAAVGGVIDIRRLLVMRVKTRGFGAPIGWSNWRERDTDIMLENAVVENDIQDIGSNGVYVGADWMALVGNRIQNVDQSHVARVWLAFGGVISHNMLSGSSIANSNGRHALKLHGPGAATVGSRAETGQSGLPHPTQFVVVSDNRIGTSGPWPISIGPQDGAADERLSDIIIERNRVMAGWGQASTTLVQVGMMFEGRYITARNNIIDGTGSDSSFTGISVARRGVEWTPLANRVFNNTIYSPGGLSNGAVGVEVDDEAADTIVQNNLIAYPNAGAVNVLDDDSGVCVAGANATAAASAFVDPGAADPLLRSFALTEAATTAIDQGIALPVFEDALGAARTGTMDIGAFQR
ncbi:MAG: PKD domain-containing protein [Deltaproteobacteria bacterium]|nr:PKD domain-containing protein [Deltaproteobacteria bacterium]